jgi:hypothetical protein
MYKKNQVFGFYIVIIIIAALIGFRWNGITSGLIGASAGIVASGIMYEYAADKISD